MGYFSLIVGLCLLVVALVLLVISTCSYSIAKWQAFTHDTRYETPVLIKTIHKQYISVFNCSVFEGVLIPTYSYLTMIYAFSYIIGYDNAFSVLKIMDIVAIPVLSFVGAAYIMRYHNRTKK